SASSPSCPPTSPRPWRPPSASPRSSTSSPRSPTGPTRWPPRASRARSCSATCRSTTATAGTCCATSRSPSRPASASPWWGALAHGTARVTGERGAPRAGEQRRRIAIARALTRDAPILILDEPMTGLDAESEGKVREALDRLMAGKTCIVITHDLQSVADADQVLVLEGGRIVDRGTHAELAARSGRYRDLYEAVT